MTEPWGKVEAPAEMSKAREDWGCCSVFNEASLKYLGGAICACLDGQFGRGGWLSSV